MYLPFRKKSNEFVLDKVAIEGPIPICSKITKDTKSCGMNDKNSEMYKFIFHNYVIRQDKNIENKVLDKYKAEFNKYRKYLCDNIAGELTRSSTENTLGNLETDIIREASGSDASVINSSAFRASWYNGPIFLEDVYNMNPFKSDIISFQMTGTELTEAIKILQKNSNKMYQSSG